MGQGYHTPDSGLGVQIHASLNWQYGNIVLRLVHLDKYITTRSVESTPWGGGLPTSGI